MAERQNEIFRKRVEQAKGERMVMPPAMDGIEPEERIAEQEVHPSASAVLVDQRVPVVVEALSRIGMLIEMRTVEIPEPVRVGWEVPRHPIDEDAEPAAMAGVDEAGEVLGSTVAIGRCVEADRLISPGAVERVLADRHQLKMGKTHRRGVGHEVVGKLAIRQVTIA